MIIEGQGNLLKASADALVNTVNTVGIMGKGVALQFKQAFPENFKAYEQACKRNEVQLGKMFVTYTGMLQPRIIVNFPTKGHWRAHSRMHDVVRGLADLVHIVREEDIRSIALPPLGCGLGGLRWEEVLPEIERAFEPLPNVEVIVFPPNRSIAPEERLVRTFKPRLTAWRAALIKLVDTYAILGFDATHHEAQKLLYFLTNAGMPLKTNFEKGQFGPYDQGAKHGIQEMDGHYVIGFGDGARLEAVRLSPGAAEEAAKFLEDGNQVDATVGAIERVSRLIQGFETPYGLELLATVHWVVHREGAHGIDEAVRLAHAWNPRKAASLKEEHLRIAYQRLSSEGWLN